MLHPRGHHPSGGGLEPPQNPTCTGSVPAWYCKCSHTGLLPLGDCLPACRGYCTPACRGYCTGLPAHGPLVVHMRRCHSQHPIQQGCHSRGCMCSGGNSLMEMPSRLCKPFGLLVAGCTCQAVAGTTMAAPSSVTHTRQCMLVAQPWGADTPQSPRHSAALPATPAATRALPAAVSPAHLATSSTSSTSSISSTSRTSSTAHTHV
jgi:hypothetical protein